MTIHSLCAIQPLGMTPGCITFSTGDQVHVTACSVLFFLQFHWLVLVGNVTILLVSFGGKAFIVLYNFIG